MNILTKGESVEIDEEVVDTTKDDFNIVTGMRRLNIQVPRTMHGEIKSHAALRGITIKKYVMRAIIERMKRERAELEGNV